MTTPRRDAHHGGQRPGSSGTSMPPTAPASALPGTSPTAQGDLLTSAEDAGRQIRQEARARGRIRATWAALAGLVTAGAVAALQVILRGTPPTPWVIVALGVAIWLGLAVHARRVAAADVVGSDRPHAATVVRVPSRGCVVVRDAGGGSWQWRHRATMRPLAPGERGWIIRAGGWCEAPHLVLAAPLAAGRYVVWATADRELVRLPDPATEHETTSSSAMFDDEPYS